MRKPMLPTLSEQAPTENNWFFEVKYDGFRAMIIWTEDTIEMISRNGHDLSKKFPEIISFLEQHQAQVRHDLPLVFDGELVILNTPYQANFPLLQQRSRLGKKEKIDQFSSDRPASFMAFDLLMDKGEELKKQSYVERKQTLKKRCESLGWKLKNTDSRIKYVQEATNYQEIWDTLVFHQGEGVVAKHKNSGYDEGKRTRQWLKIKNWRVLTGFLTTFNPSNNYYGAAIYNRGEPTPLGTFKHGINQEEQAVLKNFFTTKGELAEGKWTLPPSVCVDVHCLGADKNELREPLFHQFRFDLSPEDCSFQQKQWGLAQMPQEVDFTHLNKILWEENSYTKRDYLLYLRKVSPSMIPFLEKKSVTLIRYPDGITEQSFFQKHRPDYAPDFLKAWKEGEETFMICDHLFSLLWLGNQGTIEYHIPFEKVGTSTPDEIVFDLDPPSVKRFSLAIQAALLFKHLLDQLDIHSFIKTSGNKGMQIHIPLPAQSLNYEETRTFTESLTRLLVKEKPELFTIERLKKNRGERLYIDYVQHAEGKTIIAPYSPRATPKATVATPLFWPEVNSQLDPSQFTIQSIPDRLQQKGCPMANYEAMRYLQPVQQMRDLF